ncbi:CspA family cold shock protein [Mesorhizobium sp. J18]|uniref:cold-shock protein n=1 Tax=Mesorhizobium sp. J18 TaxID=935263 RepID=UPI001199EE2B|nr:cold shock domain-containing protein [Mesorhizobium sp. J18]TWG94094.1 CspA family cold shock protein [Mesorhizobium sp. J18]
MPYGKIKIWNADRGFGFIGDDQNPRGRDNFVHISAIGEAPQVGDAYEYDLLPGRDGRPCAVNLRLLSPAVEEARCVFGR